MQTPPWPQDTQEARFAGERAVPRRRHLARHTGRRRTEVCAVHNGVANPVGTRSLFLEVEATRDGRDRGGCLRYGPDGDVEAVAYA